MASQSRAYTSKKLSEVGIPTSFLDCASKLRTHFSFNHPALAKGRARVCLTFRLVSHLHTLIEFFYRADKPPVTQENVASSAARSSPQTPPSSEPGFVPYERPAQLRQNHDKLSPGMQEGEEERKPTVKSEGEHNHILQDLKILTTNRN